MNGSQQQVDSDNSEDENANTDDFKRSMEAGYVYVLLVLDFYTYSL